MTIYREAEGRIGVGTEVGGKSNGIGREDMELQARGLAVRG
jgi:hypothetical protein